MNDNNALYTIKDIQSDQEHYTAHGGSHLTAVTVTQKLLLASTFMGSLGMSSDANDLAQCLQYHHTMFTTAGEHSGYPFFVSRRAFGPPDEDDIALRVTMDFTPNKRTILFQHHPSSEMEGDLLISMDTACSCLEDALTDAAAMRNEAEYMEHLQYDLIERMEQYNQIEYTGYQMK